MRFGGKKGTKVLDSTCQVGKLKSKKTVAWPRLLPLNYLCGHTAQGVLSQDMKYLGSHARLSC